MVTAGAPGRAGAATLAPGLKRALIVIDVQNEYFPGGALPVTHPAGTLPRITAVMDAARRAGVPVITVQHSSAPDARVFARGSEGWQLHPEVAGFEADLHFEKRLPGAFTDTPLAGWLDEHGVEGVVIAGYMTQMCCDTTARQAVHRGLAAEFLADATGTLDFANQAGTVSAEELHRAILVTQQWRFSKVLSAEEWIASLS